MIYCFGPDDSVLWSVLSPPKREKTSLEKLAELVARAERKLRLLRRAEREAAKKEEFVADWEQYVTIAQGRD